MDINELESFKLSDAIKFHDNLNPALWTEKGELDPEVKDKLMEIAKDFIAELGISTLKVEDITISGSNAAYTYTPHSDLDLHIIVDFNKLSDDEVYQELFNAKKTLYNDTHNIKVHGVPVELYVQDSNQPVVSLGEYSLLKNKWLKIPKKRRANFDQSATKLKYEKLGSLVELALRQKDIKKIDQVLKTIKRYRKAGLDTTGEFGPENLAFKALRKQGYIKKLYDLKNDLHSRELSIEDYDPNGPPPGPEFKPTMPAGTVRVDVSDVYDWYKLGQHISNMKGLGKHDFGQGPPSTILSFGDEDTEHKYIQDLEKTGLTTTDIDPIDPNQPKGMKRQKVDPTYNVNEEGVAEGSGAPTLKKPFHKKVVVDSIELIARSSGNNDLNITAFIASEPSDTPIAQAKFWKEGSYLFSEKTFVSQNYQRKGIATLMYQFVKSLGFNIQPSKEKTELGQELWRGFSKKDSLSKKFIAQKFNPNVAEASGYIPSESEKNDPRFKTALTVDVKPDSIKKNAKAFGFKVSRSGVPPLLRK